MAVRCKTCPYPKICKYAAEVQVLYEDMQNRLTLTPGLPDAITINIDCTAPKWVKPQADKSTPPKTELIPLPDPLTLAAPSNIPELVKRCKAYWGIDASQVVKDNGCDWRARGKLGQDLGAVWLRCLNLYSGKIVQPVLVSVDLTAADGVPSQATGEAPASPGETSPKSGEPEAPDSTTPTAEELEQKAQQDADRLFKAQSRVIKLMSQKKLTNEESVVPWIGEILGIDTTGKSVIKLFEEFDVTQFNKLEEAFKKQPTPML